MDLIFYDFETTGRDPHWDQILQVGATKVSKEFNKIDSFEVRCRLKPGLIPSPFALAVNHTDYSRLIKTDCNYDERPLLDVGVFLFRCVSVFWYC